MSGHGDALVLEVPEWMTPAQRQEIHEAGQRFIDAKVSELRREGKQ